MTKVRLTLLTASPMYYQAPLYRLLAADDRLDFQVVYASDAGIRDHDAGFGSDVRWEYPLLEGYKSAFLANRATNPLPEKFLDLRDRDVASVVAERKGVWWLHGYNTATHVLARAAIARHGLPLLVREEQTLLNKRGLVKRGLKQPLLRTFLHRAHGLYIGHKNREWFRHYGVPDDRLIWAPYSVENDRLQADRHRFRPRRDSLRAQWHLQSSDIVVLAVMRLIPKKQPVRLIEAFADLARTHPRAKLLIVGDGPLAFEVRDTVSRLQLSGNVRLAGFLNQTEIATAYTAADIFTLFSSMHETWGLVINEAMNFGLPVVASDMVGSSYDLIEPGVNGYTVPWDKPVALADSLRRLVADGATRTAFGRASLDIIARQNHSRAAQNIGDVATKVGRP